MHICMFACLRATALLSYIAEAEAAPFPTRAGRKANPGQGSPGAGINVPPPHTASATRAKRAKQVDLTDPAPGRMATRQHRPSRRLRRQFPPRGLVTIGADARRRDRTGWYAHGEIVHPRIRMETRISREDPPRPTEDRWYGYRDTGRRELAGMSGVKAERDQRTRSVRGRLDRSHSSGLKQCYRAGACAHVWRCRRQHTGAPPRHQ